MTQDATPYGAITAENYQRFFVPSIAAPLAKVLLDMAQLRPGERVLDVACGTGAVTRLAADRVGASGWVAGLDVNPAMLAVASSQALLGKTIDWREANAQAMPFPDHGFDAVLCQMGLQFFPDKPRALREMRRVLDQGGRAFVSVPGPTPAAFAIMADALARHFGPEVAAFVDGVFSMHDGDELAALLRAAGFLKVDIQSKVSTLRLPPPAEFLWQYIYSTPIAGAAACAGEAKRKALEREVCVRWRELMSQGPMVLEVRMTTAAARA
jgi:ubiquinone/menaquinone biosynthesis C-methylase UbiE